MPLPGPIPAAATLALITPLKTVQDLKHKLVPESIRYAICYSR
jgi:hypothetical protein